MGDLRDAGAVRGDHSAGHHGQHYVTCHGDVATRVLPTEKQFRTEVT